MGKIFISHSSANNAEALAIHDWFTVIGFVGEHDGAGREVSQQRIGGPAVGDVAPGQQEAERPAFAVGEGMELAVASAPADSDRLEERPPFSRQQQSGAPSCILSIKTSVGGPPAAARVTNSLCQTPLSAHRT